jgi:7,8-dihydroneopterin aldolase/epimerase/oxygenase
MSIIKLNQIRVRAHHGCWEEEAVIGGDYIVHVAMEVNFEEAAITDRLDLTVDYVAIKEIVYREMAVRSKLIEQVAWRIGKAIRHEHVLVEKATVEVIKLNAPMGGDVESVSVVVEV